MLDSRVRTTVNIAVNVPYFENTWSILHEYYEMPMIRYAENSHLDGATFMPAISIFEWQLRKKGGDGLAPGSSGTLRGSCLRASFMSGADAARTVRLLAVYLENHRSLSNVERGQLMITYGRGLAEGWSPGQRGRRLKSDSIKSGFSLKVISVHFTVP